MLTERFSVQLQTFLHNSRTVRCVHIRLGEEGFRCNFYCIQSDTHYIQSVRRLQVGVTELTCSVLNLKDVLLLLFTMSTSRPSKQLTRSRFAADRHGRKWGLNPESFSWESNTPTNHSTTRLPCLSCYAVERPNLGAIHHY